jgi:hypothetical protein
VQDSLKNFETVIAGDLSLVATGVKRTQRTTTVVPFVDFYNYSNWPQVGVGSNDEVDGYYSIDLISGNEPVSFYSQHQNQASETTSTDVYRWDGNSLIQNGQTITMPTGNIVPADYKIKGIYPVSLNINAYLPGRRLP